MDISGKIKTKLDERLGRSIPKPLLRRILLGLVLIVITNTISFTSGTPRLGLLILLVGVTPILITLDYRQMWRGSDGEDFSLFRVMGSTDYQSIIAITFASHSLITYGLNDWINIALSWGIAFPIGFLIYPMIMSWVLSKTWDYTINFESIKLDYREDANEIGNIYYDKNWVEFNNMLYSLSADLDLEEYSLVRTPLDKKSDFTFLTKLPPDFSENEHSRELSQGIISSPRRCYRCDEKTPDKSIKGIVRERAYPYIYKCKSRTICQQCVMESVMDISESEDIPELTTSDLVAKEI